MKAGSKKIVAANWKMNKALGDAISFASAVKKEKTKHDIIIFPPFPFIEQLSRALPRIPLGAQNCHQEEKGAFTGEISASMVKSVGCTWVLVGHSERRQYQKESNALINQKIKTALKQGLKVMLCVGETEKERKNVLTEEIIKRQLKECLIGIEKVQMGAVAIAYEPVWAIGTGNTASPKQAQEVHSFIRATVNTLYEESVSRPIKILYGGSVTPENAVALFKEKDINGALVGGASLDVEKFVKIANS
jgi:triosephosphate isomerase (TIM)